MQNCFEQKIGVEKPDDRKIRKKKAGREIIERKERPFAKKFLIKKMYCKERSQRKTLTNKSSKIPN